MFPTIAVNDLELSLTRQPELIRAAQDLRYRVFYEEMGARADAALLASRRDADAFDVVADHLVVIDRRRGSTGAPRVVGCYRLLRGTVARDHGGFYSAAEFDLDVLAGRTDELVELGRSCVAVEYRNGTVMQLLWRGIAHYLERHGLRIMIGCASLPGTDLEHLWPTLAYLATHHLAPVELRPRAVAGRMVALPEASDLTPIELRRGKAQLPPLLKAYLRMGGLIGDGAVLDHQFNTTDVCLVLPTDRLQDRYLRHLATPTASDALAA